MPKADHSHGDRSSRVAGSLIPPWRECREWAKGAASMSPMWSLGEITQSVR